MIRIQIVTVEEDKSRWVAGKAVDRAYLMAVQRRTGQAVVLRSPAAVLLEDRRRCWLLVCHHPPCWEGVESKGHPEAVDGCNLVAHRDLWKIHRCCRTDRILPVHLLVHRFGPVRRFRRFRRFHRYPLPSTFEAGLVIGMLLGQVNKSSQYASPPLSERNLGEDTYLDPMCR